MKKFVVVAMTVASFGAVSAMAETMNGFISDSHCNAAHDGTHEKDAACPKVCVKKGSDPVFVTGGKVLKFDSSSAAKAKDMAGEKVTIDGTMNGDTVTINSITKASS
jgi:hypothetical protein